jgi:hypothetical protein
MARQPLVLSPNYLAVVRGIRELHRLALAGRDDSPEADAIRDATDGPWKALSEVERKRASGLSEDLDSISDSPESEPETNPQARAKFDEAIKARDRGEWDRALELLRRWSKHLAPEEVNYLRGSIWMAAGDAATAVLFFEYVADFEPERGD